jgi:hypothetical protein
MSPLLVWRSWPSGEKATAVTLSEWPSSVLRSLPPTAVRCSRWMPTRPAGRPARRLRRWPRRNGPVAASYSRTVLSWDADATSWLSSEKARALTTVEWPLSVLRHDPVAASHSRTVQSSDAAATSWPSGEKARALTLEE